MNIKKGDQVKIVAGKDRDKTGNVLRVLPTEGKLVIEGVNIYKKRVKPKKQGQKGETVLVPRPIQASNVMLACPGCKRGSRVGYRVEGGSKIRYCKRCKAAI